MTNTEVQSQVQETGIRKNIKWINDRVDLKDFLRNSLNRGLYFAILYALVLYITSQNVWFFNEETRGSLTFVAGVIAVTFGRSLKQAAVGTLFFGILFWIIGGFGLENLHYALLFFLGMLFIFNFISLPFLKMTESIEYHKIDYPDQSTSSLKRKDLSKGLELFPTKWLHKRNWLLPFLVYGLLLISGIMYVSWMYKSKNTELWTRPWWLGAAIFISIIWLARMYLRGIDLRISDHTFISNNKVGFALYALTYYVAVLPWLVIRRSLFNDHSKDSFWGLEEWSGKISFRGFELEFALPIHYAFPNNNFTDSVDRSYASTPISEGRWLEVFDFIALDSTTEDLRFLVILYVILVGLFAISLLILVASKIGELLNIDEIRRQKHCIKVWIESSEDISCFQDIEVGNGYKDKDCILLIHGFNSDMGTWEPSELKKLPDGTKSVMEFVKEKCQNQYTIFALDFTDKLKNGLTTQFVTSDESETSKEINNYVHELKSTLNYLRETIEVKTIHMISHSTGGLVVRLLNEESDLDRVNQITFLGVPHRGARGPFHSIYYLVERFGLSQFLKGINGIPVVRQLGNFLGGVLAATFSNGQAAIELQDGSYLIRSLNTDPKSPIVKKEAPIKEKAVVIFNGYGSDDYVVAEGSKLIQKENGDYVMLMPYIQNGSPRYQKVNRRSQKIYPAHHSFSGIEDQDLPVIHHYDAVWEDVFSNYPPPKGLIAKTTDSVSSDTTDADPSETGKLPEMAGKELREDTEEGEKTSGESIQDETGALNETTAAIEVVDDAETDPMKPAKNNGDTEDNPSMPDNNSTG